MRVLLDLVLPAECAGCGAAGATCCARCRATLAGPPWCSWPRPSPPALPTPWSVAAYDGAVRALVLGYKERGVGSLAAPLGHALAAAIAAAIAAGAGDVTRPVVVVPAPSTAAARRERGGDVVARLARVAAAQLRRTGVAAGVVPAVRHRRAVDDSSGLSAADRAANLAGAFAVHPPARRRVAGAQVVLADDLITTGATLAHAATVLREAGAQVVGAATIAATMRRPGLAHLGLHKPATEHYRAG